MVTRFLSGQKPAYKPVDYEKVQLLTQIRKSSANNSLKKVKRLENVSKRSKEEKMLHEHRRVWEVEMRKLRESEDRISQEIDLLRPPTPNLERTTSSKEEVYEEIYDYKDYLHYNLQEFVKNTLDPIKMLQEDLLSWMASNKRHFELGHHNIDQERAIMKTVKSVKEQQATILVQLKNEQEQIEIDIQQKYHSESDNYDDKRRPSSAASTFSNFTSASSAYGMLGHLPKISLGPPSHLFELYCPDKELAENCLLEFDVLDEKFSMDFENLEENYSEIISKYVYFKYFPRVNILLLFVTLFNPTNC